MNHNHVAMSSHTGSTQLSPIQFAHQTGPPSSYMGTATALKSSGEEADHSDVTLIQKNLSKSMDQPNQTNDLLQQILTRTTHPTKKKQTRQDNSLS